MVEGNLGHVEKALIQVRIAESFHYATTYVLIQL
jgi:hypothetical protein